MLRWKLLFGVLGLVVASVAVGIPQGAVAQEQFFTQSGGRGLQNAKTNARLTKTEADVGVIQEDLKTIQPHARAQLGNCSNVGEKLRYDGRNWVCDAETDPTVKGFAKKDLPSCSGTSILGVTAGELGCVASGFVSDEIDPTVQAYAKAPLPSCGNDQVLTVANGNLTCQTDQKGLSREFDPQVHDFARRDIVTALPNCGSNELLTMTGARLSCKVDSVGITLETDPLVQNFARTDNGQAPLAACASGEVLRSVTLNSKVVLACQNAAGALTNVLSLNDLSDVNSSGATSGTVLTFSGSEWQAVPGLGTSGNPLLLSQLGDVTVSGPSTDQLLRWNGSAWVNSDDKVGALTDTNWCHVVSGKVVCDRPMPLTCNTGEALKWNGTTNTWLCEDIASSIAGSLTLGALGDVTITAPIVGQALRFDGTGWANSSIERIIAGDTQIVATDTGTDGLLSFATDGVTRMAITNEGRMGVGVMPSSPYYLDVSGSARVAGDLTVTGNLNISGSQSIDGVTFANGGIQLTGNMTGDGISATNISATGNVSANQFIGDGSRLTGVIAASAPLVDRISSTNNQAMVVATSAGTVSFTLGGTPGAAYLDPNLGLVARGVSVSGPVSATRLDIRNASSTEYAVFRNDAQVSDFSIRVGGFANYSELRGGSGDALSIGTNNSNIIYLTSSGNTGIWTTLPSTTLHVNGTLRIANGAEACDANRTGAIRYTGGEFSFCRNGSAWETMGDIASSSSDRITSGTTNVYARSDGSISFTTAGVTTGYFYNGQLVANGVSATGAISGTSLATSGNLNLPAQNVAGVTNNMIMQNGNPFVSTYRAIGTTGLNLFVGVNNGNTSMSGSGNDASYNLAFGNNNLMINTSGSYNVIFGVNSMTSNTTGNSNAAFGVNALRKNTVGIANTGIGHNTLYENTSGVYNTAVGYNALIFNATGTNNTAVGYNAGRSIISGSSNTIIGANVIGLPSDLSNTVILADGDGNRRLYVDFIGRMGIGKTSPTTGLDVSGTLRIANGAEACDANRAGGIRYNSGAFEFCSGSAWQSLGDIASASSDRITSGTTNVYARSDGSISFTTAGVTTGYFYNGQLVANGISTTGAISGTSGFISGMLAANTVSATTLRNTNYSAAASTLQIGDSQYGLSASGNRLYSYTSSAVGGGFTWKSGSNDVMTLTQIAGNIPMVGIGLGTGGVAPAPSTSLHISGTLRLSNGAEACDANRAGGIRYNSGAFEFCSGSAWSSLAAVAAAGAQAAGVVGSVQYKGAANEISGSANYTVTNAANRADVAISGTLKVAGDGSESCSGSSHYGQMRFVDDGGQQVLQICRP